MNLRQELDRYLTIRRRLGYDLSSTERVLRRFIAFAESQGAHHISTDLFVRWQAVFGHAQRRTWAARLGMVRLFAQWLHGLDPAHEIPPTGLIPVTDALGPISTAKGRSARSSRPRQHCPQSTACAG
jgi:integrase/recombinase XerD